MNESASFYSMGISIVPALIAFAATFFHKKGVIHPPISGKRRLLSAVVIYAVCLVAELILTMTIAAVAVPNPQAYENPLLIISGLLAYFAGRRVIRA